MTSVRSKYNNALLHVHGPDRAHSEAVGAEYVTDSYLPGVAKIRMMLNTSAMIG